MQFLDKSFDLVHFGQAFPGFFFAGIDVFLQVFYFPIEIFQCF